MSKETKQTAVDLMFERAISVLPMGAIDARQKLKETYLQAKAMEKEQIVKAVTFGNRQDCYDATETLGEQYYNEKYSKQEIEKL